MKHLIIFLLALLPAMLMAKTNPAKSYKYNNVYIAQSGNDNFSTDNVVTEKRSGEIIISHMHLTIDGKEFDLKSWKKDNIYKAKGYLFKFVYTKEGLRYVQQFRYDKVYWYSVQPESGTSVAIAQ